MKALLGSLVLCLGFAGCARMNAAPAAFDAALTGEMSEPPSRNDLNSNVASTNDRFNGVLKIDWSKSRYIEELKSRKSSPNSKGPYGVKEEVVKLTIANNTEHCINDLLFEDGT